MSERLALETLMEVMGGLFILLALLVIALRAVRHE